MMRVAMNDEVSESDIQDIESYRALSAGRQKFLRHALSHAALKLNCRPIDLRWAFDASARGAVPLKIYPPKKETWFRKLRKRLKL